MPTLAAGGCVLAVIVSGRTISTGSACSMGDACEEGGLGNSDACNTCFMNMSHLQPIPNASLQLGLSQDRAFV